MIDIDSSRYRQVLGDELRQVRRRLGWTREDLRTRMGGGLSIQTLATYELGTRQCTLMRFVAVCVALGESPGELLARVHRRVAPASGPEGGLSVNLAKIARNAPPVLEPLRRWAQNRLALVGAPADDEEIIPAAALDQLAHLCGLPLSDVIAAIPR